MQALSFQDLAKTNMENKNRILVVDESPKYIKALESNYSHLNYEIVCVDTSQDTFKLISEDNIDLILLDVMLKDKDAFELCKTIKDNNKTKFIPIIIISSSNYKHKKITAIESGADDFISRPINISELLARINSLLKVKSLNDELEKSYAKLKNLQKFKDDLSGMLIHDINNILVGVKGNLDLMKQRENELDGFLKGCLKDALESTTDIIHLLSDFMDITRLEENKLKVKYEKTNITELIFHSLGHIKPIAGNINFIEPEKNDPVLFEVDNNLISRVLTNLLINAIKFTPANGKVSVGCCVEKDELIVSVKDTGPGIPEEYKNKIFEKFCQMEIKQANLKKGRGLGLTFCKLAIEAHNGKIWIESEGNGKGSEFIFSIPKNV